MQDLTDEEYKEWNTCPGCGQEHRPSLDCDGTPHDGSATPPPPTGGAPSQLHPPSTSVGNPADCTTSLNRKSE